MAVAFDVGAVANGTLGTDTSLTYNSGSTSASATLLIVAVGTNVSGANPLRTVSSVTYGGTNLTFLGARQDGGVSTRIELWYLVSPASGVKSIVVTISGTVDSGAQGRIMSGAASFTGSDTSTPLGSFFAADWGGTASTPATVGVTDSAANDLVFAANTNGDDTGAVGAGQTQRFIDELNTLSFGNNIYGSTEPGASGTVTMSYTQTASSWVIGAVTVKQAAAGGGSRARTPQFLLLGLGS